MIIMPDTHQPTPTERLLTWKVAYTNYQAGAEKLRNEPKAPPSQDDLNESIH